MARIGPSQQLPLLDLLSITREHKRVRTTITLTQYGHSFEWIRLGQAQLYNHSTSGMNKWMLGAYLAEDATDFEHSPAHAIAIPLIGITFLGVSYQHTMISGWVTSLDGDSFRVPPPGYNPLKHPQAVPCSGERCGRKHIIVPEAMYQPARNPDLFDKVRGCEIRIDFGPKDTHP